VIESSIYAQYPEVEIYETEDYVHDVPMNAGQPDSDWDLWGATLELTKADPYPIKTYIDYGLDKDPKEEFKNDPLATLIELLGSLKQGEAKTTAIFEIVLKASPYGLMVLPSYVDGATSILPVARGEDEFSEFLLHIRRGNGTITFGRPVEYQYIRPTEDEVARAAPHCGDCDPRKRVTIDRVMRLIAELCPSEGGRGPYRFV